MDWMQLDLTAEKKIIQTIHCELSIENVLILVMWMSN